MSLFDAVKGVLGASRAARAHDPAMEAIGALLQVSGGVGGLVAVLQRGGLGKVVDTWVGTGANQPLDGERLGRALTGTAVGQIVETMGQRLRVAPALMYQQLAQQLPAVVDQLTPGGNIPAGQREGFDLGDLACGVRKPGG